MNRRATESGESRYERRSRSSLRLPVACRTQWIHNDVGRVATTRDLSTAGLFLPTPTPLACGTVVDLNLTLDPAWTPLRVGARVVRSTRTGGEPGMALSFTGHRLAAAQTEVANFLLASLEARARAERRAGTAPAAVAADPQEELAARERDLGQRLRTFERVVQAVRTERERLLARDRELRQRQQALDHREACLERMSEALAVREAALGAAEVTLVTTEVTRPGS